MAKQQPEQVIDYYAHCGECNLDAFYDEIESALSTPDQAYKIIESATKCKALQFAIMELLRIHVKTPDLFDFLVFSIVFPEMTDDERREAMQGIFLDKQFIPGKMYGNHRARVSEKRKALIEKYPKLKSLVDTGYGNATKDGEG